jgi:hypothetical protein
LKGTLNRIEADLDKIVSSADEAAAFAEINALNKLGGALVLIVDDPDVAAEAVTDIRRMLRISGVGTSAFIPLNGDPRGFAIPNGELGSSYLTVFVRDERVVIGFGPEQALDAMNSSFLLAKDPDYQDAVDALGDTPISVFVDGPKALEVLEAPVNTFIDGPALQREAELLLPGAGFNLVPAGPSTVRFVAIGSDSDDERATAKLIVGLKE